MIVKNLTSELQEIEVREITDSRVYKCYIEPNGTTELDRLLITNLPALTGIIEIVGQTAPVIQTPVVPSVTIVDVENPGVEDPQGPIGTKGEEGESGVPTPEINEDKFICDECQAEFASARSLAAHKSRSHSK